MEIDADRRIDVRVLPREEAFALPDIIRTATNLVPPEVKDVRIVDIVGLDQQADGGTHVASTRQVGRIEVVKVENKGKGFRRLRIRIRGLPPMDFPGPGANGRRRSRPGPARMAACLCLTRPSGGKVKRVQSRGNSANNGRGGTHA